LLTLNSSRNPSHLQSERLDGDRPTQLFNKRTPPFGISFGPGTIDSMRQFNHCDHGECAFSLSLGRQHALENIPNALAPALSGN
jgi:hypothetical protein